MQHFHQHTNTGGKRLIVEEGTFVIFPTSLQIEMLIRYLLGEAFPTIQLHQEKCFTCNIFQVTCTTPQLIFKRR